jgi:hypothetical protein
MINVEGLGVSNWILLKYILNKLNRYLYYQFQENKLTLAGGSATTIFEENGVNDD